MRKTSCLVVVLFIVLLFATNVLAEREDFNSDYLMDGFGGWKWGASLDFMLSRGVQFTNQVFDRESGVMFYGGRWDLVAMKKVPDDLVVGGIQFYDIVYWFWRVKYLCGVTLEAKGRKSYDNALKVCKDRFGKSIKGSGESFYWDTKRVRISVRWDSGEGKTNIAIMTHGFRALHNAQDDKDMYKLNYLEKDFNWLRVVK